MRISLLLLVATLLMGTFSSCVSKKKYDELAASKAATDQQLAQTRQDLSDLTTQSEQMRSEFEAERTRMSGELDGLRGDLTTTQGQLNDMSSRLEVTEAELAAAMSRINDIFASYEATGLEVANVNGKLHLVTDEEITFRSSSARLSRSHRDAIDAMAAQLAGSDINIMVEGHTDNKKFIGNSTDNWDLSYRRAKAVATRLIRGGVSPANIIVAGAGEYDPVGDNSNADGRAQNRRTIVRPNPSLGELMNDN